MTSLRHTIYVACRPEELWAALTEGEQTRRWYMSTRVQSSFEVGATIVFTAKPVDTDEARPFGEDPQVEAIRGRVLALEPEQVLVHSFAFTDFSEPESEVRWRLSRPRDSLGVVQVDLEHVLPEGCPQTLERVGEGWAKMLSGLKTWVETSAALGLAGLAD